MLSCLKDPRRLLPERGRCSLAVVPHRPPAKFPDDISGPGHPAFGDDSQGFHQYTGGFDGGTLAVEAGAAAADQDEH